MTTTEARLLEPDRDQLERFVADIFRHVGNEGFVSIRAFYENDNRPFRIQAVSLNQGLGRVIAAAEDIARRTANERRPGVFCPPLAVFSNGEHAREEDLLEAPALSVELDAHPRAALAKLVNVLGPPTVLVRSGGQWVDPQNRGSEVKLHIHWRLAEPARGDDLAVLKHARRLATKLVGGDPSNVPTVHPMRWPGSWHCKRDPVLCEIEAEDPDREIALAAAVTALVAAAGNGADADDQTDAPAGGNTDDPAEEIERADWAVFQRKIINGEELHDSTLRLLASYIADGIPEKLAVRQVRALMLISTAPHDERWQARMHDLPRLAREAVVKFKPGATGPTAAIALSWQGEAEAVDTRSYLVDKLLLQQGTALISGQWGTYKTFVGDDLAASVMTGGAFAGFPVKRRGGVLWFACEGVSEVGIRITAAWEAHGGQGKAPFAWVSTCPPLLAPGAATTLIATAQQAAETMRAKFDLPLALIIIDTIGRAAGLTKEGQLNDDTTAKVITEVLTRVSAACEALCVGIAHFGKNKDVGTKGSTGFEDDADTVLALLGEKDVTGVVADPHLVVRKRRWGSNGEEVRFIPREVTIGTDADGSDVTTLVLQWTPGEPVRPGKPKKDAWEPLFRQVMLNAVDAAGADQRPYPDGPTVRAVDVDVIRMDYYRHLLKDAPGGNQEARKKRFQRAMDKHRKAKLIQFCDIGERQYAWITDPAMAPGHAHA